MIHLIWYLILILLLFSNNNKVSCEELFLHQKILYYSKMYYTGNKQ